jgi:GAF domain-containing protein
VPSDRDKELIEVAEAFDRVARQLLKSHDMPVTLQRIVEFAVETLDACQFAGISLVENGRITSPASSNDVPMVIDALQSEFGEGPCIDAIKEHEIFVTGDLKAENRWPKFAPRAYEETGVLSILSHRLFAEANTMGSLNLYSTARDAFDEKDIAMGGVFATHAAVAMDSAKRQEGLELSVETRDIIGQAKGIIMSSMGCSADAAFAVLIRQSQYENRKLVDIAAEIAHSVDRRNS